MQHIRPINLLQWLFVTHRTASKAFILLSQIPKSAFIVASHSLKATSQFPIPSDLSGLNSRLSSLYSCLSYKYCDITGLFTMLHASIEAYHDLIPGSQADMATYQACLATYQASNGPSHTLITAYQASYNTTSWPSWQTLRLL